MRLYPNIRAEAADAIATHHRDDLDASFIKVGTWPDALDIAIDGERADRADFLRRLAAAALEAAAELDGTSVVVTTMAPPAPPASLRGSKS